MYVKTISGVDYHLYEDEQEFRKHHLKEDLKDDWRKAGEGEWALSDDGQVFTISVPYWGLLLSLIMLS